MTMLPLDLFAQVETASGATYRWSANESPGSRPLNLSFRTKLGEGFSDANCQLARRIDFDYPDLNLLDTVSLVGADGSVAYEGRVQAMPRELTDTHSIGVTLVGWMAHAKDRKFTEVYIDRDLGAWTTPSLARRASLTTNNFKVNDPSQPVDPSSSQAGVTTAVDGAWASPYLPISEAWYDAGPGLGVGAVYYQWKRSGAMASQSVPSSWDWRVYVATDDTNNTNQNTGDLDATGPGSGTFTPTVAGYRYALLQVSYGATPAGVDGANFAIDWYKLAVIGNHGLTRHIGDPSEPAGVYASDVIKDIANRFCPRLSTAGVGDSSYVIQHLTFKDLTDPYDAFLEVNKYHLWHLGVWENKILTFRPYDLTDYDWEIRTDDPGTNFTPQGPSTEDVFNGMVVTYDDVLTGTKNVLTPDGYPTELSDAAIANPWNQHGIDHWGRIDLSSPTLQAQALEIGRAALAQSNVPKATGTITVAGRVRDRAGNEQPVWKIRAGDTIAITNFPNDAPRLIHETSYDDETKTTTISVDAPAAALDAVFDRLSMAITAAGAAR